MLVNPISMIDTTFYHILSIYVLNFKTISTEKANWFNYEGIDKSPKMVYLLNPRTKKGKTNEKQK